MMQSPRLKLIEEKLNAALNPSFLEVIDDSAQHVGHAGAEFGAGHYTVKIAAEVFKEKSRIAAHREVYAVLGDMIPNEIHALRIEIVKEPT